MVMIIDTFIGFSIHFLQFGSLKLALKPKNQNLNDVTKNKVDQSNGQ